MYSKPESPSILEHSDVHGHKALTGFNSPEVVFLARRKKNDLNKLKVCSYLKEIMVFMVERLCLPKILANPNIIQYVPLASPLRR